MVARDNFFFFLECCDFSEYGSLGSVWRSVPSWVLEASLLDRHLACQHGGFLQEIWVHTSAGSLRVILRKPLPLSLMQAFWCWVCVLHFIRLNKLINSADSERLHNLSNVNSHLNYPNFILNLQNPITG